MKDPLVSVIIPFYNRIDWLSEAVESVLQQTYKNYEIIIINDGSREDDTEFLKKYKDKINYIKTKNRGPAAARNKGINIAKGEYIAFLDSDDLWYSNKLEKQIKKLKETNAVWCHCGFEYFGKKGNNKKFTLKNNKGNIFPLFLASFKMVTPAIIIKTDLLQKNNDLRFSEEMRYGQDDFLWLNISLLAPVEVVPEVLVKVRLRGSNAATRAIVRLRVAYQLWDYIKNNKAKFSGNKSINSFLQFIYFLSYLDYKFLLYLKRNVTNSEDVLEAIAKVLFLFPFVLRRIYAKSFLIFYRNRSNEK